MYQDKKPGVTHPVGYSRRGAQTILQPMLLLQPTNNQTDKHTNQQTGKQTDSEVESETEIGTLIYLRFV